MLGCWQDPIANSNLIPAAPIRLTLANKFVITMVLVEVSWAIVSHPVAAARVLSRRNAGKLSWRKAASKRRSKVGFVDWTLGQDNRKFFWWMVLRCPCATSKTGLYTTRTVLRILFIPHVIRSGRLSRF